jgi:hypothetical protein
MRNVSGRKVIPQLHPSKERYIFRLGDPLQEEQPPIDACTLLNACEQSAPDHRRRPRTQSVGVERRDQSLPAIEGPERAINALPYGALVPESREGSKRLKPCRPGPRSDSLEKRSSGGEGESCHGWHVVHSRHARDS